MPSSLHYYAERAGLRSRSRELLFFDTPAQKVRPSAPPNVPLVRRLDPDELRSIRDFQGWRTLDDSIRMLREHAGWRMLGAFSDSRLLGSCWLETGRGDLPHLDLRPELGSGSCHVNYVHVTPAARRQGIAQLIVQYAAHEAGLLGCQRVVLCCAPENEAMTRLMARLRWRPMSRVIYRRALCLKAYAFRSADGAHVTWTARRRSAEALLMHWGSQIAARPA